MTEKELMNAIEAISEEWLDSSNMEVFKDAAKLLMTASDLSRREIFELLDGLATAMADEYGD